MQVHRLFVRKVVYAVAMTGTLAVASLAQKAGEITEFHVNAAQELCAITAGADGNLWAIDPRTNKILRLTTNGAFMEFQLSPSAYPADITAGPDGNVWYGRRGEVGKITPTGEVTAYKVDGMVSGITAGPDGNLWFCETFRGKIGKCTTSGVMTMYDVPTRPGNGSSNPLSIAAGPDGKLWFTESNPKANKVASVSTSGEFAEYALPHEGVPRGITAGPDGNLWVCQTTNLPDDDRIVRVTPDGQLTEFVLAGVKTSLAQTIVSGPDSNLWFTEPNNPSTKVSKITATGDLTRLSVPTAFSGPAGLTVGPDGNLWFTERAKSKIGRLWCAAPDTSYVLNLPSGFVPTTVTVEQGKTVEWVNKMPGQSSVFSAPALDSSSRGTGQHFTFQFNVAGTYRYADQKHESHTGTVVVPLKASPTSGSKSTMFDLSWATGALPKGCVVDIEVAVPEKEGFTQWQAGVATASASFEPKDGVGTYRFRSRLREKVGGRTSDWSPVASVSVN